MRFIASRRYLTMDRSLIEQHLSLAEAHVAKAERVVREQRELIAQLERDGHDAQMARQLLATYEQSFRMHLEDRERLRSLLASGA